MPIYSKVRMGVKGNSLEGQGSWGLYVRYHNGPSSRWEMEQSIIQ